ncbi:MAG: triose-phosphate isomerase [Candidatus Pacearchaeota archaeon]
MKKPIVIVNFKTYKQGWETLELANIIESVDRDIIVGLQATDIYRVSSSTRLSCYCQHVDYMKPGRNTGFILPESVQKNGGVGSFLNHSEHSLSIDEIKKTIIRCKEVGLKTAVFANSFEQAKKIEEFSPDYLIYEPPELVAGEISVSSAKPEVISKICKTSKIPVLVGAGIRTHKDVLKSIELGSYGIAISSAITIAKDPKSVLKELLGKF